MGSTADTRRGNEVTEADLFYDDRRDEHYVAIAVTDDGVTLRRRDTEYYVPHSIFADWYDPTRVTQNDDIPVETPDWVEAERASTS